MFVKIHIGHTQSWFSVELRASRELANQVQLKSEIISAILFATPEYHIKSSHCHNDYRHRQHHRSDRSLQARPAITWSASVFPDNLPSTTHHVVATHQGSTNNTRTLTSSLAGRPTMILPSKTAVYQTLAKQCRETVESRILQTVVHQRDSLSSSLSVLLMSSQAPGKCARSSL